jgi:hypothetical protein
MGIFSKVASKETKQQQVEEPIQNDEVQKETKKQKVEGVDLTIEEF